MNQGMDEKMNGTRDLTLMQGKLLDMLRWFDSFCRENNLRYYAIGGTMLGAVRHHGFIPWDDDVDVGMPRKDYEKLAVLLENRQMQKYVLETPKSESKEFCYPYSKVYDTTTTLIENAKHVVKRGIFIDVFPLDGIGNNKSEIRKKFKKIRRKYDFYLMRKCGIRKGRKLYKNIAVLLLRLIPERIIDDRKLRIEIDRMCAELDFDSYTWGGCVVGAWSIKEIMEKKIFGMPTEYQFEDITILGVEDYEQYLTNLYGNWRQPPPKEKQVSIHDFIECDLEKPFVSDS